MLSNCSNTYVHAKSVFESLQTQFTVNQAAGVVAEFKGDLVCSSSQPQSHAQLPALNEGWMCTCISRNKTR
jgi:hypothetical protein